MTQAQSIDHRVCHYTSSDGLISIIQGHSLRASSAAFMNDANEMRSGAIAIGRAYERRKRTLSSREIEWIQQSGLLSGTSVFENFLLSAAEDPDSLTLWRSYGVSEVAYSVELDPKARLVPLAQTTEENHPFADDRNARLEPDDEIDGVPFFYDPNPDEPIFFRR